MSYVSWGKNRIIIKDIDTEGSGWEEMPTPAEDSTELSTNDGDKMEAPVEGGANEDVKYKDATYTFKYDIRDTKGKAIPLEHENGKVEKHYAVCNVPEDAECPGCYIPKTSVVANDTYKASEGFKTTFTHESLVPDDSNKKQMRLGKVEVTEATSTGGNPTIKFYPLQKNGTYASEAEDI